MTDPTARWEQALRAVVGLDDGEVQAHLAALHTFCRRSGTDPVTLLARWEEFPELTVRRDTTARRARDGVRPNLAVESYLIHNGVNVFGDLVCVPRTTEDLSQQWRPERLASLLRAEGGR